MDKYKKVEFEPPRVFRRQFVLSHATLAECVSWKPRMPVWRRCMLKSGSKQKSFRRPWQKSGEAIFAQEDGVWGGPTQGCQHTFCLCRIPNQRNLLPLPTPIVGWQCLNHSLVIGANAGAPRLGIRFVLCLYSQRSRFALQSQTSVSDLLWIGFKPAD